MNTAEREVLRALLQGRLEALGPNLRAITNWPSLIGFLSHHRLHLLLYRVAAQQAPDAIPETVRKSLGHAYAMNVRQTFIAAAQTFKTLARLAEHDIAAVPFKGPVLGEMAHGDAAVRVFGDLDFLIPKASATTVYDLLSAQGWTLPRQVDRSAALAMQDAAYEYHFRHPEQAFEMGMHFAVATGRDPCRLSSFQMLSRARTVTWMGRAVQTLCVEDHVLALCLHHARHGWDRLEWVATLARLAERATGTDWMRTVERARAAHCARRLLVGVLLSHELASAPWPGAVIEAAQQDRRVVRLARGAREALMADPPREGAWPSLWTMGAMDSRLDGMRMAVRMLAVPSLSDFTEVPVRGRWRWLLPLVRPFRLLRQAVRGLVGRARRQAR